MAAIDIAKAAKAAFITSQLISSDERIRALHSIIGTLREQKDAILTANAQDLQVFWRSKH